MNKTPWWYWPASFVPIVMCGILGSIVFHMRIFREEPSTGHFESNSLTLGFVAYAALVVLGYLLLVFCQSEMSGKKSDTTRRADYLR